MLTEGFVWLEATVLARELRDSVWAYPLVSAGHLLGVALLVGSIVPLDLKLLGGWRNLPLAPLWQMASRTAAIGLALAVGFGSLLFMARATEYVASPYFLSKMAIIAAGAMNALLIRRRGPLGEGTSGIRVGAAISLVAWLSALLLGRLVGYF